MVRFGFFVDDKHVVDILRALAGRAKELEIIPVNIMPQQKVAKGEKGTPKGATAADTVVLFVEQLKKDKHEVIDAKAIKASIQKLGWSATSYSHYIQGAIAAGLMKRGKKLRNGFTYVVK